jgi:outer membrane biogenesis lipoprotein LolB
MQRRLGFSLTSLAPFLLLGCTETPDEAHDRGADPTWSDQQERIHQLREVIRYEDVTQRQRQGELEALALPVDITAPAEPVVPAGEGQDQAQH